MKKVIIDLKPASSVEMVHEYLKFELEFPGYYGANLDALYDELTSICGDVCVGLFYDTENTHGLQSYIRKIIKVFRDAELENRHLCVITGELADNYPEEII